MHIPSLAGSGTICPVTSAVASVGVVVTVYKAFQSRQKSSALKFITVTSLILVGQMFDFLAPGAVSWHLIGGVLAVSLLGIPFGVLSMILVLSIQCFLLGDGGVSALGANIIQMAFIAAGFGGLLKCLFSKYDIGKMTKYMAVAFSAWASVVSASLLCAVVVLLDNSAQLTKSISEIVSIHLFIGVGEALMTVF